jgi:hypothetical protein
MFRTFDDGRRRIGKRQIEIEQYGANRHWRTPKHFEWADPPGA